HEWSDLHRVRCLWGGIGGYGRPGEQPCQAAQRQSGTYAAYNGAMGPSIHAHLRESSTLGSTSRGCRSAQIGTLPCVKASALTVRHHCRIAPTSPSCNEVFELSARRGLCGHHVRRVG